MKSILTFLRVLLSQRNAKVPRYPHWQTEKKLTKCIVVATAAMLIVIWRKTTKNIVLKQKVYLNFRLKKITQRFGIFRVKENRCYKFLQLHACIIGEFPGYCARINFQRDSRAPLKVNIQFKVNKVKIQFLDV